MRLFLYTVHDSCAGVYERPWCARSDGEAMRSFQTIACDATHPIGQHPEHYSIFRVGTWDDNSAKLEPEVPKTHLANAIDLVVESRKNVNSVDLSRGVQKALRPDGNGFDNAMENSDAT